MGKNVNLETTSKFWIDLSLSYTHKHTYTKVTEILVKETPAAMTDIPELSVAILQ